jgi:hypothetical protein
MTRHRLSLSRRREDIGIWWAEHLAAQHKSGRTRATYSRARGLDRKYVTLCKGSKLRQGSATSSRMVPVVVTPSPELAVPALPETAPPRVACACPWATDCCCRWRLLPGRCRRWCGISQGFDAESAARYAHLHGGGGCGHQAQPLGSARSSPKESATRILASAVQRASWNGLTPDTERGDAATGRPLHRLVRVPAHHCASSQSQLTGLSTRC